MLFSGKNHIDVLSHYTELAITFVIHLSIAIMRHGTYYETPAKILLFAFLNCILLCNHIR